jgi:hypothetical protein
MSLSTPRDSDLLIAAFDVTDVWVERNGRTVRGTRPDWLSWPCVRGDEFAPLPEPPMASPKTARRGRGR